jgi:tRNA U34 5-methylaminomethyl-2-thiouridine-forming methyltransferase MnmC
MNHIVKTSDGSDTIFVPELNEHYHSIHGAIQESEHIFIKCGFDACKSNPAEIFEIGFGTGLNALLTALRCVEGKRIVNYTSIEKYPLSFEIIDALNYDQFGGSEAKKIFKLIHKADWNVRVQILPCFSLLKIDGDFLSEDINGNYDLIYFDAFGPDKQPEMWSPDRFLALSVCTKKDGILVTYSSKGAVKRSLTEAGFKVELLPGPPGKRQIIRAVKN